MVDMNKLQEKRKLRELSQSQLAKLSDVPLRTLTKYESGELEINKAKAEVVYRLAKTLGCKVEDLIDV